MTLKVGAGAICKGLQRREPASCTITLSERPLSAVFVRISSLDFPCFPAFWAHPNRFCTSEKAIIVPKSCLDNTLGVSSRCVALLHTHKSYNCEQTFKEGSLVDVREFAREDVSNSTRQACDLCAFLLLFPYPFADQRRSF